MATKAIELKRMPLGYDRHPQRIEVSDNCPQIWDEPGVTLQGVEGNGYTVYHLTPDEARAIAAALERAASKTEKEFEGK